MGRRFYAGGVHALQDLELVQDVGQLAGKSLGFVIGQGDAGQGGDVLNLGVVDGHKSVRLGEISQAGRVIRCRLNKLTVGRLGHQLGIDG